MNDTYKFPFPPVNAAFMLPKEARDVLRRGEYYGTTAGFCLGYVQANLAVIPASEADNFEEFCRKNPGPLPLLYRSKPGDVTAPPLAEYSDVRTDLPRYLIFSHGRQVEDMRDLLGFSWEGRVSFYLGCSYSFEEALLKEGIRLSYVENKQEVSMYVTNVDCYDVGNKFSGVKMVVSMRNIVKDQLQKAVSITSCYTQTHGAPIHIGDPNRIGISDITKTITGTSLVINEGEVPVFWACGVTAKQALQALKADLAFTHYPGSMFITDLLATPSKIDDIDGPQVIAISPPRCPYYATLVSHQIINLLKQLESIILHDPGNCGVQKLREDGDFIKSVLTLSHSESVAVFFGFPCNFGFDCLEETDGPPGALAIAQALQTLGKKVVIVSEERNREILEASVELIMSQGDLDSKIEFLSCKELLQSGDEGFDCLVAIERVGQAKDGAHYTFKGIDVTQYLDPIDELFIKAAQSVSMVTIGIGDRGNELGLGRVKEKVLEIVPNGVTIGCHVASDFVVLAGVSNWGGYAIAAGLYLLATCPIHWRYLKHGINTNEMPKWKLNQFVPTDKLTEDLLRHMNDHGVRDGITKSLDQSVDGIPLKNHLKQLQSMRAVVFSSQEN